MKRYSLLFLLIFVTFRIYAIDGLVIKTIDYCFKEKWDNTVGSSIPKISSCDTVFKNQFFFLTAIAWNYASNSNDISNVVYSIKVTRPDNTIYFSQEDIEIINGKILNKNNFQMSEAIIKASFNDSDMPGNYKIEMMITDKISGKTKAINSDITLALLPSYDQHKIADEKEFLKWFDTYYENPRPENALAYYIFYSQSTLANDSLSFWPLFSTFIEITKNNTYLLSQIIDCYKKQNLKTKIYLLYLLTYSNIDAGNFLNSLTGDEKNAYLKIKNSSVADIYGTISNASQLDMLWGTFMANGSYKPILKLIETLDYAKYQGDLDKFKTSKQTSEDRQKAINNAIYNAVVWSVKSNCKQHELVKEYCNWALEYEQLSDVQKNELAKILKEIN